MTDAINPAHYTAGRRFEVIDVIEDFCQFAPEVKQGIALGNALKYLSRIWTKGDDPTEHVSKAIWYLERLQGQLLEELDLGDDLPWDANDDPYWHPDTALFGLKNAGALKNLGLIGGISDGDLSDEDWAKFYEHGFHIDVDDPPANGSRSMDVNL